MVENHIHKIGNLCLRGLKYVINYDTGKYNRERLHFGTCVHIELIQTEYDYHSHLENYFKAI